MHVLKIDRNYTQNVTSDQKDDRDSHIRDNHPLIVSTLENEYDENRQSDYEQETDCREEIAEVIGTGIVHCTPQAFLSHYLASSSHDSSNLRKVLDGLHHDRLLGIKDAAEGCAEYYFKDLHCMSSRLSWAERESSNTTVHPLLSIGQSILRCMDTSQTNSYYLREGGEQHLDSDLLEVKDRVDAFLSRHEEGELCASAVIVPMNFETNLARTRKVRKVFWQLSNMSYPFLLQNRLQFLSVVNTIMNADVRRNFAIGVRVTIMRLGYSIHFEGLDHGRGWVEGDIVSLWYFSGTHSTKATSFSLVDVRYSINCSYLRIDSSRILNS